MTVVSAPCILDFGKAYVDSPPDYTAEALGEAEQAELLASLDEAERDIDEGRSYTFDQVRQHLRKFRFD